MTDGPLFDPEENWEEEGLPVRWSDRLTPRITFLVVVLIVFAGLAVSLWSVRWGLTYPLARITLSVGAMMIMLGLNIFGRWRRRVVPQAREAMAADKRDPILYLRMFVGDGTEDEEPGGTPRKLLSHILELAGAPELLPRTTECRFARVLNKFGPCIALGSPHDKWPYLGFSPLYAWDASWRDEIRSLVRRAQMIIIRASHLTPALEWELQTVLKESRPGRLFVFFPNSFRRGPFPSGNYDYDAFRARAQPIFRTPLPEWHSDTAFLVFDSEWGAHIVKPLESLEHTLKRAMFLSEQLRRQP